MEDSKDQGELAQNKSKNRVRCFTMEISKRKIINMVLENNKVVSIEPTWKNQIDLDYLNSQLQSLGKYVFMDDHLKRTLEILIGKQRNRLLGGGCGASAEQRIQVPEKKTNPRKITTTNPITAENTLMGNEANNSKDQDLQAIQQNFLDKPTENSGSNQQKTEQQHQEMSSEVTVLEKKVQAKSKQSQLWNANKNSNFKIDPQFLAEFAELTNTNKVYANLGVKQSSDFKQQSQQINQSEQENQLDDDQPEEVNLQAEIMKIEDCVYKYRRGFGDSIKKYSPYYIELFELILTYQLIGVCQQNSSSAQFLQDQKNKLIQLKEVCVSQQQKQPALDIIFYLDFFIKVKGSSFPRTDDFMEVINAVKKCSARLYTFGIRAAGMVQGNFKDGFEELLKLSKEVISLIQEVNAKNLFKVILRIYIEKMNFLKRLQEKQQQKQIVNVDTTTPSNTKLGLGNQTTEVLEEEILFYIEKFNNLVETDKEETQEDLAIYLMLRINYLLQKIQQKYKIIEISDSGKTTSNGVDIQGGKNKEDNSKSNIKLISFDDSNVIRFVKNLIVECEDRDFTDSLKGFLSISVSNYYLRFASLSLQIRLRKIFSKQQNSQKSELLRLLQLNAFRWYMNETQTSIKILLYCDEDFQQFVHPADDKNNKKLGLLNELAPCKDFYEEYLKYDNDWRNKIGQYIDLGKTIIGTVQDVSQVMQKIEENLNIAKEIADKIL